jgi:hypothetical protein
MTNVGGLSGDMAALAAIDFGSGATVNTATEPTAPRSVVGVVGDTQVSVSWGAPSNDGGSAITDYIVEYQESGVATWSVFADGTSSALSATVTGLTNARAYQFRVSALNVVNTGAVSTASVAVTPDTTTTTTSTTTTTTTIASSGNNSAPSPTTTTSATSTTSTSLPATTTTTADNSITVAARTIPAVVVPAFASYSVALSTTQQQLLLRYSKLLRAGDTVNCVGYSEPNPFGVVTRISIKRAQAVCSFLASKVRGLRTAWSAQLGPTTGIRSASAALTGRAKAPKLARRVVVTATPGS